MNLAKDLFHQFFFLFQFSCDCGGGSRMRRKFKYEHTHIQASHSSSHQINKHFIPNVYYRIFCRLPTIYSTMYGYIYAKCTKLHAQTHSYTLALFEALTHTYMHIHCRNVTKIKSKEQKSNSHYSNTYTHTI